MTGLGIRTAIGGTVDEVWSALASNDSGLTRLELFDSPRYGQIPVGEIKADPADMSGLAEGSRTDHLAACAGRAAFADAGLDTLETDQRRDVGVVLGTCTGGMKDTERFLETLLRDCRMDVSLLRHHMASCPTEALAGLLDVHGFRATVSTACASGASAVAVACDVLRSGEASMVLAGGADSLTRLTVNGFGSLLIVDPDGCHPFDRDRAGMSLGEGAGVLVLETAESARERGARVHAWLAGWGSACDAFHATAADPDGGGAIAAMRAAMTVAGTDPRHVHYVNAHGTGTKDNDTAEGNAIRTLFQDRPPLVSSTKRFFGHTLAAAGAIEAIVCVLALRHQAAPGTLGLRHADPETGLLPLKEYTQAPLDIVMSNSLGFGGNCCSLVIRRTEEGQGS